MRDSQKIQLINLFFSLSLIVACALFSDARAKDKSHQGSPAHKQFDFWDPQDIENWVSQLNVEVDRYTNSDYLYSSISVTRKNWSYQIGSQNAPLSVGDPTIPFIYAGITKQIDLNSLFNITLGSQLGSYTNAFTFLNFDYFTFGVNNKDYTLAIGPYYVNKAMSQTFNTVGYIVYWNYNLFDFTINGNYISGYNNMSGLAVNLGYNVNRYFQPYVGFGDVAPNLSCDQCNQYYYMAFGFNINI